LRAQRIEEAIEDRLRRHPETTISRVKRLLTKLKAVKDGELPSLPQKVERVMGGVADKNLQQVNAEGDQGGWEALHVLGKHECKVVAELASTI
jgi:hypothetical protein